MAQTANTVDLKPHTLEAFKTYIAEAEKEMEHTLRSAERFRWSERSPGIASKVGDGEIVAQLWSGKGPEKVPDGLIHDWIGAAIIAGATLKATVATIQDYDNHKNIYTPDVMESKLIARDGNDFQIYLRLLKKKVMTVVLDTDHDVHYRALSRTRWCLTSYTTRIAEVENPGKANETVLAPDTGFGFLWRLNSYWRFEENGDSVYVECRAISLTRDVPAGLGWILEPIIRNLPKESLINTLKATRAAVLARARRV